MNTSDPKAVVAAVLAARISGAPFWHLYGSKPDLGEFAGLFFHTAWRTNMRCVCLGGEAPVSAVAAALSQQLPDFTTRRADGDFLGLRVSQTAFREVFATPRRATLEMSALSDQARSDGYIGVRLLVDLSDLGQVTAGELVAFERAIAQGFGDRPGMSACAYPLADASIEKVLEVARASALLTANRDGVWAIENSGVVHNSSFDVERLAKGLARGREMG